MQISTTLHGTVTLTYTYVWKMSEQTLLELTCVQAFYFMLRCLATKVVTSSKNSFVQIYQFQCGAHAIQPNCFSLL